MVTGVFTPGENGETLLITSPYAKADLNLGVFTGSIELIKIKLNNVTSTGSTAVKMAKVAPAKVAPAKVVPAKVVPAKTAVKAKIVAVKKSISKKAH